MNPCWAPRVVQRKLQLCSIQCRVLNVSCSFQGSLCAVYLFAVAGIFKLLFPLCSISNERRRYQHQASWKCWVLIGIEFSMLMLVFCCWLCNGIGIGIAMCYVPCVFLNKEVKFILTTSTSTSTSSSQHHNFRFQQPELHQHRAFGNMFNVQYEALGLG